MRVLVVEDDVALAEWVANKLCSEGMTPSLVGNGLHAVTMLTDAVRFKRPYDAVALDLTLPGCDGLDVLAGMRRRNDRTPVLIMTARGSVRDRVGGLAAGADDYLPKPFDSEELIARLRAIARRNEASLRPTVGNLSYDSLTGAFLVDDCILTLTPKLHAVLEVLFRRRGSPVSKDFLANMDLEGATPESVDTTMSRLRKRLRDVEATVAVRTIKLTGFLLEAQSPAADASR